MAVILLTKIQEMGIISSGYVDFLKKNLYSTQPYISAYCSCHWNDREGCYEKVIEGTLTKVSVFLWHSAIFALDFEFGRPLVAMGMALLLHRHIILHLRSI